ncbi:A24 family peptidase [Actinophytocola sp.]|uniref:A24 family peptidase n=1 Tax=Actinophytocola sp. TaxID=1872138 RepID=UPI002ED0F4C2
MHTVVIAVGAVTGALAGGWLRAVVWRLAVGQDEPDRVACAGCDAVLLTGGSWWRGRLATTGRCPGCGARVGAPDGLMELAAGAALAAVAGVVGPRPELLAFWSLTLLGVALTAIDVRVHRLPDRLTLPAYPVLAALLAAAAVVSGEWARLGVAVAAGAATGLAYLALVLLRPDQLGLGDAKLAGLLGAALGWFGWMPALLATALAFAGCAVVGLGLLVTRRGGLRTAVPLGPFMVAGALAALLMTL